MKRRRRTGHVTSEVVGLIKRGCGVGRNWKVTEVFFLPWERTDIPGIDFVPISSQLNKIYSTNYTYAGMLTN